MTKKKNSKRRDKSDEEREGCDHVFKAVRLASINNTLSHMKIGNCDKCQSSKESEAEETESTNGNDVATCICLRCSFQGCSRDSKSQHALAHYKEFPSHPLNINIKSWLIWCYACDNEVPIGLEKHALFKCVKFIRKHVNGSEPSQDFPIQAASKSSKSKSETSTDSTGVMGLSNLGNTCFFNAVIQNITQTSGVMEALKISMLEESKAVIQRINKPSAVLNLKSQAGSLTSALFALVKDFQSSKQKVISPGKLFGEVCKKAPMFRGYQQQDSQELFHYILDGIRSEELARVECALKSKAKELSIEKKKIPDILRQHRTFIDDLFSGILVSSVVCSMCKEISQTFDRFFDLSLPIVTVPQNATTTTNTQQPGKTKRPQTLIAKAAMSKHQRKMNAKKERKQKGRRGRSRTISRTESESTEIAIEATEDPSDEIDTKNIQNQISVFEEIGVDQIEDDTMNTMSENPETDPNRLGKNGNEITQKPDFETSTSYVDINLDDTKITLVNGINHEGNKDGDTDKDIDVLHFESKDTEQGIIDSATNSDHTLVPIPTPNGTEMAANAVNKALSNGIVLENGLTALECHTADDDNGDKTQDSDTKAKMKGGDISSDSEHKQFDGAVASLCKGVLNLMLDLKNENLTTPDPLKDIENNTQELKDNDDIVEGEIQIEENGISNNDDNDDDDDEEDDESDNNDESEEIVEPELPLLQPGECSIISSLHDFFTIDYLTGNNQFNCEHCAGGGNSSDSSSESTKKKKPVLRDATKQFSISSPPNTLVLHLKRFAQTGRCFRKLNKYVDFKLTLDISRYCTPTKDGTLPDAKYTLYGIVEHSGSLNGGHYVAYIRNMATSKWYCISDSHVSEITEAGVLRKQAYMLFYRRVYN